MNEIPLNPSVKYLISSNFFPICGHVKYKIQGDLKVLVHNTYFFPHYLDQSGCLAADRQGQGDTRLTLTPSVIPNSNYVIMVIESV
jgi:hypothetical protein